MKFVLNAQIGYSCLFSYLLAVSFPFSFCFGFRVMQWNQLDFRVEIRLFIPFFSKFGFKKGFFFLWKSLKRWCWLTLFCFIYSWFVFWLRSLWFVLRHKHVIEYNHPFLKFSMCIKHFQAIRLPLFVYFNISATLAFLTQFDRSSFLVHFEHWTILSIFNCLRTDSSIFDPFKRYKLNSAQSATFGTKILVERFPTTSFHLIQLWTDPKSNQ